MTRHTSEPRSVNVPRWNNDAFAVRLKRAAAGKTAYSLERETGIAESLIRKYMNGKSIPGADKLVLLAAATGVSVGWLAIGEERKPDAPPGEQSGIDLDQLEEVVVKTRRKFKERGINLTPESEGKIIRLIYEFYQRQGKPMDDASLNNVIELAAFR